MSEIFTRPITQQQIDAAKKRRAEKLNEQIQLAYDYVLTDLMTRIAEVENAVENTTPALKKSAKK